ncbi:hypothetical protein EV361DRAFT_954704 [Lentinula raphanica]|uniref:Uncharacterized protein n=1 Tax=Lentinula raphanica TaxID=153919 RepID=A0AA38U6E5_9AGAR|nr:hypothetical protein EV360DRAFT_87555 [Lentinula raphanica]KAJ3775959.1 hypothetical protein FB446DRAFT_353717 [Lentinula raphanica]KAJ3817580.1 hypothetical protein F5880DRAFT_1618146 [Lentinula raphanica]KAJ3832455.1 hypothetical protein F5878DRAFT_729340 [Lentinula raphanica]KAJ3965757.1 hypothetical protein EV361DRAFT_954704 [Lentinula raphanica]
MADSLGISEAQILGLFLASVFWGMLLITFVQVMKCFLWDTERGGLKFASKINWPMLIVALLLMALSTFDVSLGLMHCIEAFILYTGPGGSTARFTGLTDWVNILKTCNIVFGKVISDGVLIYRCWAVCNYSILVIVFPILLWLGYLGLGIFVIFLEASAGNPKVILTGGMSKITPSITAGWTMSLVNNIITTGIIVYRIRRVDKSNVLYGIQGQESTIQGNHGLFGRKNRKRTRLQNVIRIIIESGMMYTTIAFITFITFVVGSSSFYATSDAELQILSIAFNLIIIRISTRPGLDSSTQSASARFATPQTYPLRKFSSAMKGTVDTDPELDSSAQYLSEDPVTTKPPQSSFLDVETGN